MADVSKAGETKPPVSGGIDFTQIVAHKKDLESAFGREIDTTSDTASCHLPEIQVSKATNPGTNFSPVSFDGGLTELSNGDKALAIGDDNYQLTRQLDGTWKGKNKIEFDGEDYEITLSSDGKIITLRHDNSPNQPKTVTIQTDSAGHFVSITGTDGNETTTRKKDGTGRTDFTDGTPGFSFSSTFVPDANDPSEMVTKSEDRTYDNGDKEHCTDAGCLRTLKNGATLFRGSDGTEIYTETVNGAKVTTIATLDGTRTTNDEGSGIVTMAIPACKMTITQLPDGTQIIQDWDSKNIVTELPGQRQDSQHP